jgi:hypothetical protein
MWTEVEHALTQSAASVMAGIARLLPGTIAFLVSVLVAVLVGRILAWATRRGLAGIEFDRLVTRDTWADYGRWTGTDSPSALVSHGVFWVTVLGGVLAGIAAFDPTLTSQLALRIFGSVMDLLTAIVLLVVGNVLARFAARGTLISLVNMNVPQARLFSVGVKWLVLVLTGAMALDHLNIGGRIVELAFGILFGGIVLTLALIVGLRSKDLASWPLMQHVDERQKDERQPVDHL